MNKKIILSIVATALVASSLVAFNPNSDMRPGDKSQCKQGKMMKGQKVQGRHMFMNMVMELDLDNKQRGEIDTIIKESMQNLPNPKDAFTASGFDKKLFVKLAQEKRDSKIQRKADMMEKVYSVLNSSQKKDLKTMMDMRDIMKKSMNKCKKCDFKQGQGK
ncbi:MAG: protein CpxP [Sulfurimonas sp.]|jgi:protein CpxP